MLPSQRHAAWSGALASALPTRVKTVARAPCAREIYFFGRKAITWKCSQPTTRLSPRGQKLSNTVDTLFEEQQKRPTGSNLRTQRSRWHG